MSEKLSFFELARRKLLLHYKQIVPFKSQRGQDVWVIFKVFPFKRNGYFIELAAADGVTHSNTYALEKLFGWTGICIEPNPSFLPELEKNRTCTIDPSVVNNVKEDVVFRIDNGQLGGIVAEDTDNNYEARGEQLAQANLITLQASTLTDILDKHNAPKVIDYFSLDVEGSEERVLLGVDFQKYMFKSLTVERPSARVNEILFANGYVFVKNYMFDTFYIHESVLEERHIRSEKFEQLQPKTD